MNAIKRYFSEAVHELRQVKWPTKNQAVRISVITIIFVFTSAAVFKVFDLLLTTLIGLI
jgi:preprotein translocase SecE subunit